MAVQAQEWTLSGLAAELKKDRRILAKIIDEANVEPTRSKGRSNYYRMADVVAAMIEGGGLNLEKERSLLAQQQTRRLLRENDEAERNLISVEEVVDLLQKSAKIAVSILEALPLNIKRRVPALKARDIEYIKLEIAKSRNAIAEMEVE